MATRKRNEWLEANASDEEENAYDSEELEHAKSRAVSGRRASKRRKLSSESDSEDEDDIADGQNFKIGTTKADPSGSVLAGSEDGRFSTSRFANDFEDAEPAILRDENDNGSIGDPNAASQNRNDEQPKLPKELSSKHLSITAKAARKSGVIYLSRIPPFMKPSALRSLLAPYAPSGLNRIFLTPESPETYSRRKRAGGNKKRSFVDGWVEFLNKREAKICAETLNGQIVGGKKGGWYHDDVWSMKYLSTFKWSDLVEQMAAENVERAARMRLEISQSNKANKEFVDNVQMAKALEGMERKRREKNGPKSDGYGDFGSSAVGVLEDGKPAGKAREGGMLFRQNKVKMKTPTDKSKVEQPEQVMRVLSKIF